MFERKNIVKTIHIEGMSCMHCVKKVEEALKRAKEIKKVEVNLGEKKAIVTMKQEIANEELKNAVEDLGYKVEKIE